MELYRQRLRNRFVVTVIQTQARLCRCLFGIVFEGDDLALELRGDPPLGLRQPDDIRRVVELDVGEDALSGVGKRWGWAALDLGAGPRHLPRRWRLLADQWQTDKTDSEKACKSAHDRESLAEGESDNTLNQP